ncbi:MAG TPA: 16S rRNA (cytosine(1402)-N(4))-methyltransferase RsmH, partial [Gemmatales bacterium]|nr:16S rRNA (cytosine(1402)-N(4))-methyltransferase RsmH [Gemmatales bacterium]
MYRSTPHGEHVPVLLTSVLECLAPRPGETVFDGTLGFGGHASALLKAVGPTGLLFGTDFDPIHLEQARNNLQKVGHPFHLHHGNYAGVETIIAEYGLSGVDMLLVDLGMSSMQVDEASRGFSYMREGPLDMRMDPTRGKTAAEWLHSMDESELAGCLADIGDEENAELIARAIVQARSEQKLTSTVQLSRIICQAVGVDLERRRLKVGRHQWKTHPAARTFQVLRILVNRELSNLEHLLRVLPTVLHPGGRVAIISFHSGEDRR